VSVLRVLSADPAPISQRELARRARVPLRSTQAALRDLHALGVVRQMEGGRDYLVAMNMQHLLAPAVSALFSSESTFPLELRRAIVPSAWTSPGLMDT
jgi:DNA-binding IclR family transcriptional regulator